MRKTFFLDIDGVLLEHIKDFQNITKYESLRVLPGACDKTTLWHCQGHLIILTTARPESLREITQKQLQNAGVMYDMLLMGLGSGPRVLVNDYPKDCEYKAFAYNLVRNVDGIIVVP